MEIRFRTSTLFFHFLVMMKGERVGRASLFEQK
jgi:hypothetical protein